MKTAEASMHWAATRQAMPARPSNGSSSSRAARTRVVSTPLAAAVMPDHHIGRCPHAQILFVRLIQADANGESLGHTHPVQGFLHERETAWKIDHVGGTDSPPDVFDLAGEPQPGIAQKVDRRTRPHLDIGQVGFAEESGGMPAIGIDEREEGL